MAGVALVVSACLISTVAVADASTSPAALRSAIFAAASSKRSVHYLSVSSGLGAQVRIACDVATDHGVQRVTFSRGGKTGHVTMLVVDATAYLRGDAFTLRAYMDFPASFVSRYAGKWLAISRTSRLYGPVATDVTIGSFIHDSLPQRRLSIVSGSFGRKKARGLHGTAVEGGTLTLYVPVSGSPLPLGGNVVLDDGAGHRATSQVTMSHWNEAVRVQRPAHAVPFTQ